MSFFAARDASDDPRPAKLEGSSLSGSGSSTADSSAEAATVALVARAQAGDRDAFDEIVFLYRDQIYATAWQLARNADDALDVTQEVFLRAFRALSSFKGSAKFSTWLHRIVLNASVDHVRRERRHWKNVSETEFEKGDDGEPGRSLPIEASLAARQREAVYAQQLQRRVNACLAELSPRQREVFLLRYYQDLNLKEVAAVMRCTEGAVKRHLYRAQLRLREMLDDLAPR